MRALRGSFIIQIPLPHPEAVVSTVGPMPTDKEDDVLGVGGLWRGCPECRKGRREQGGADQRFFMVLFIR